VNDHEAQRIASAMNRLRPDWPTKQLLTLIREHLADRPRRDVTVALAWIACETASHNPYRVLESGPWWLTVAVDGQTTGRREPYDPTATCAVCGRHESSCRRNPLSEHEFVAVVEHNRELTAQTPKPRLPRVKDVTA
jgi:hypothetical protein